MARITLENIKKTFGKVTALDGVSLDIKDKEFFVLFGPAGAGKTTILNNIAGILFVLLIECQSGATRGTEAYASTKVFQLSRTCIRGHDDYRIAEVYESSVAVGESSLVEHL